VVGALEAEIQTLRKSVNEASTVVTENIQLKVWFNIVFYILPYH
jgi:hypothetical protein